MRYLLIALLFLCGCQAIDNLKGLRKAKTGDTINYEIFSVWQGVVVANDTTTNTLVMKDFFGDNQVIEYGVFSTTSRFNHFMLLNPKYK